MNGGESVVLSPSFSFLYIYYVKHVIFALFMYIFVFCIDKNF